MDFNQLAQQHKDAVYRHMIRVCRNREDAEDVLMEALIRAFQEIDHLHHQAAFRAWLRQIAQRICWDLRSKASARYTDQLSTLEQHGLTLPANQPGPHEIASRNEMKARLNAAVERLPEPYWEIYELRDVEEQPGDQVAHQLGLSTAAMKSRLHRARQLLREYLDQSLQTSAEKEHHGNQS